MDGKTWRAARELDSTASGHGTSGHHHMGSALWCHITSECLTESQCVWTAMSSSCQVESCHTLEPHRLPVCLDSLDTTVEGHCHVWVPHSHRASGHVFTLTPLSGTSTQKPTTASESSPPKIRPTGRPCPHRSPHGSAGRWSRACFVFPEAAPTPDGWGHWGHVWAQMAIMGSL